MELHNCYSKEEKELKEIELTGLTTDEMLDLAHIIKAKFNNCILEDESIVVNAVLQIAEELGERLSI